MSQTQYIDDTFGAKIGGSRRDVRRMFDTGEFSFDDLDEMDMREVRKLATKDRLWPEPDWASLDADPGKTLRVRLLRAAMPGKCPAATSTEDYIRLLTETRVRCGEYLSMHGTASENWDMEHICDAGIIRHLATINRKAIREILNPNMAKYHDLLTEAAGWPARTDSPLLDGYAPHRVFRGGQPVAWSVSKNDKRISGRVFETNTEAINYINDGLLDELRAAKVSEKPKRVDPVRPMLEGVERSGPDRGDGEITPEIFQETFRFRGGEFGTWLTQEDRRQSLRYAYDAFMDLAEIIGIEPGDIGGGKLGFAFGARGVGKHAAHYEPALMVINLTKMNGAGAAAHEWGHYLDYTLGSSVKMKASDSMTWLRQRASSPEEQDAIFQGRIKEILGTLGTWIRSTYQGTKKNMDLLVSADPRSENFDELYRHVVVSAVPAKNQQGFLNALSFAKRSSYGSRTEPQFYKDAQKLDETRSKKYWSTEVELFARVFEKYVDMRMREDGMSNNYLVTFYEHPDVSAYPSDEEMAIYRPHIEEFLEKRFPSIKIKKSQNADLVNYPALKDEAYSQFF